LAATFAEVWSAQPSRRDVLPSSDFAVDWVGDEFCADRKDEVRKNSSTSARVNADGLTEFMKAPGMVGVSHG
jgi:hypothetical protein